VEMMNSKIRRESLQRKQRVGRNKVVSRRSDEADPGTP
jgi:hypothetical protein